VKLIVDDKIPYIADFFGQYGDIVYLPGEKISHADLQDADILLIRTVTQINEALLKNTSVQFVGTVTTGTDHIDIDWLSKNNITLATAAGANSEAVAEYVTRCVDALKIPQQIVAGIIGCGRIGRIVATHFQRRGCEVLCYDPLLTEQSSFHFTSLEKLISESDLISLHVPLTKNGLYPTFHLLNEKLIKKMKSNIILLNTSRGAVIDQAALLQENNMTLCLDVWEDEPHISLELLNKVTIGTPHIAGYSIQAKYHATKMIYDAAATLFGWPAIAIRSHFQKNDAIYDPIAHTQQFRAAFQQCQSKEEIEKIFIRERKNYPLR